MIISFFTQTKFVDLSVCVWLLIINFDDISLYNHHWINYLDMVNIFSVFPSK